jgi:flagellar basal-body rod modification protein FlgD
LLCIDLCIIGRSSNSSGTEVAKLLSAEVAMFSSNNYEVMTMASVSGVKSASDIQFDYMKLLVTQMQNQNPLEPLNNDQMATQMAQFSQLQQLETMNSSFSKMLTNSDMSYASSLIGKYVAYVNKDDGQLMIGKVDSVVNENGQISVRIGNKTITADQITAIGNDQSFGIDMLA